MDEEKKVQALLAELSTLLKQLVADLPGDITPTDPVMALKTKLRLYQDSIYRIQQEFKTTFHTEKHPTPTLFDMVFDAAPVAFLILDSNLHVAAANEAAKKLLKAPENSLLHTDFNDMVSVQYKHAFLAFFNSLLTGMQDSFLVQLLFSDNTALFTQMICKHLQMAGEEEKMYLILLHDAEEWKGFETKLIEQNLVLQQNNAELDKFMYSVSHDLRSPLVSIMGVINIARMETEDAQMIVYLGFIEKSVRKLDNFVQDLINLSKNHATEIRIEPIKLRELISGIFDQLQYIDNVKRIRKIIEVNAPAELYSDKERLSIVLNNLLSNAIKYHKFDQEDPFIRISIEVTDQLATIALQDNGMGIGKQHLDKIFTKFYRASQASKGSGLGLFIVKETMERLGGHIGVISEEGKGSTFTIIVPNRSGHK